LRPHRSSPFPYTTLFRSVVHLPELLLDGGSFRGLRGMLSMRVALGQGKVPKDKAQAIPQTPLNLLDDRIGPPTIGTLIITVFHQDRKSTRLNSSHVAISY